MQFSRRKVLGLLILAFLGTLGWFSPMDTRAKEFTEAGLQRALVTFAAARALNATLSVLQSSSVNVQAVVAGASLQVGAVLDPLDDLVEQFSSLMLAATLSFATQRLLIEVTGVWQVSLVLSGLFLAWGVFNLFDRAPPRLLARIALGLLCLRLAVPAVALGSELTYLCFLAGEYEEASAKIAFAEGESLAKGEGPDFSNVQSQADEGWIQSIKRLLRQKEKEAEALAEKVDVEKKVKELTSWVESSIDHIVRLAAVFIVQTVILPLVFLWGMFRLYRIVSAPYRGVPWGKPAKALATP